MSNYDEALVFCENVEALGPTLDMIKLVFWRLYNLDIVRHHCFSVHVYEHTAEWASMSYRLTKRDTSKLTVIRGGWDNFAGDYA